MIRSNDITFVVQGPIRDATKETLKSIRLNFKESIIILSTWEGSDVQGLDFDTVIYNKDPGSLDIRKNKIVVSQENTNRQIVSTHHGLIKVKTQYAVKLRTDMPILNTNIIKYYKKAQCYESDINFTLLEERVLVSSINTIDPNSYIKFPYHISDWIYFGKTSDLLKIWNGELVPNDEYFTEQNIKEEVCCERGFDFGRFTAEQLVLYSFLRKNRINDYNFYCDVNEYKIEKAIKYTLSNFYCVSPKKLGVCFNKYEDLINIKMSYNSLRHYFGFYLVTINESVWR
ncbi:wavE lipopolysaccharide synthesis family protein, partial [Salmonella enterica]|nr:wavE lipopolysaccharide synthesis family protein [Salmonella enterica]EDU3631647.1 wavE lipopolysaccharide synthesis family protein [Salmonella enterica]